MPSCHRPEIEVPRGACKSHSEEMIFLQCRPHPGPRYRSQPLLSRASAPFITRVLLRAEVAVCGVRQHRQDSLGAAQCRLRVNMLAAPQFRLRGRCQACRKQQHQVLLEWFAPVQSLTERPSRQCSKRALEDYMCHRAAVSHTPHLGNSRASILPEVYLSAPSQDAMRRFHG